MPTRKPGESAREMTGTLKASHRHRNLVILSQASGVSAPPERIGWLAMIPTLHPPIRAKPVSTDWAILGRSSRNLSSSTILRTTRRMS